MFSRRLERMSKEVEKNVDEVKKTQRANKETLDEIDEMTRLLFEQNQQSINNIYYN